MYVLGFLPVTYTAQVSIPLEAVLPTPTAEETKSSPQKTITRQNTMMRASMPTASALFPTEKISCSVVITRTGEEKVI
jgi:hypothetical protein